MRCLVTGAAGFIGSHLVEALLARGDEVVGVDSFTDYYDLAQKRANVAPALGHPAYELLEVDVGSDAVREALHGVDAVFHQAGQPGVRLSWDENFHDYVERNVLATQRLLDAALRARVPRIVYASSSSVYGNQAHYPCAETAVPAPYSPYGVTKLAGEHLCGLYAQNHGTPTVSLRYFTVYGPRQRPDMAFSLFLRRALAGQPVSVTGDGEQVRDFTFVDDVVAANLAAAGSDAAPGSVFNVCGTESVTVNDVLAVMGRALGAPVRIDHVPTVAGDVRQTGGSSAQAERVLGWRAGTDLVTGIARQAAWEQAWERTRRGAA